MNCDMRQRWQILMTTSSIGGQALKRAFGAGVGNLHQNVDLINRLNVFPVPDGDTGINMLHTLRRACQEIDPVESDDLSLIAEHFAYGALMGARGNSGTILSQLLKGFANGLDTASALTPALFVDACQAAVQQGYAAVSQPTEGTILTVAREATEALPAAADGASMPTLLETLTRAAQTSLENTPNLLPILKDAGVVDAGGMGLVCFLQGLCGGGAPLEVDGAQIGGLIQAPAATAESYGYDVQFLMSGKALDPAQVRHDLEAMGWSVIVVGDARAIKVHIHVHNPATPLDYAIKSGAALDDVVVENMTLQYQRSRRGQRTQPALPGPDSAAIAVIAVAAGDGLQAVLRDLNCSAVISGGAGQNPATADFLSAIEQAPSEQVIILPNDRNIELAARQAADLSASKTVQVVPTETVLHGINAMLAFGDAIDSKADLAETAARMQAASAALSVIAVTRASRTATFRDLEINQNDYIAIVDGMICAASPDIETAILEAFASLAGRSLELATFYYGAGVSTLEAEQLIRRLTMSIKGLEFELVYGGQTLYSFLISVE